MVVSPIASALTALKVKVKDENNANRADAPNGDRDKQRVSRYVILVLVHTTPFEAVTSITTLLDAYGIWKKGSCTMRVTQGCRAAIPWLFAAIAA